MDNKTEVSEIKIGDEVTFLIDLRGFLATYQVIDIKNESALIVKTHLWKTDPYEETWQPLSSLRKRGRRS